MARTLLLLLAFVTTISRVHSHMVMSSPAPRSSAANPGSNGYIDYSYTSPLTPAQYPCKGYAPQAPVATYAAGSTATVTITGGAPHNGGHCQFSLSYDNANFVALSTVIRTCMQTGSAPFSFQVPIPANTPAGKATLAWSWVNASGNREFYMNCADVTITNPSSTASTLSGPKMLVADLAGISTITFLEFGSAGVADGHEYYSQQPTITIGPSAQIGTGTATTIVPAATTTTTSSTTAASTASTTITSTTNAAPAASTATTTVSTTNTKAASMTGRNLVDLSTTTTTTAASTSTQVSSSAVPTVSGPGTCVEGDMECVGTSKFAQCSHNYWYVRGVPAGTKCASNGFQSIMLVFAS